MIHFYTHLVESVVRPLVLHSCQGKDVFGTTVRSSILREEIQTKDAEDIIYNVLLIVSKKKFNKVNNPFLT